MANELPLNVVLAGALPAGFTGTPQQIAEAIVARLRIQSTQSFALLASGATEPSSNVGPWLKDDVELWVWDNDTGGYVPLDLNADSIEDGSISVAKLEPGIVTNPFPFRASSTGTGQAITVDAAGFGSLTDIQLPSENFDPNGVYNAVTSIFTAPESGWYVSSFFLQIDNSTTNPGVSASMQIGAFVADAVTNANLGGGSTTNVPSPTGDRWFLNSYDIIQLTAQQTVKLRMYAVDGTGANAVDVAGSGNCYWSMYQLKVLT